MSLYFAVLMFFAVVALAAAGAHQYASNSPCPKFRCNQENTGVAAVSVGRISASLAWSTSLSPGGALRTTPAFGANGNVMYLGTFNGALMAVDAKNGTVSWAYANDGAVQYSNAAVGADGTVYVGNAGGSVWALNADGKLKWISTVYAKIDSSPILSVDGKTLYFGCSNYNLYAIDTSNGRIIWQFATGNGITTGSPVLNDGTIYVGSSDGFMYSINAATGTLVWKFDAQSGINTAPIYDGGRIYFAAGQTMNALSAKSGSVIWYKHLSLFGVSMSSPALSPAGDFLYVGTMDNKIMAISTADAVVKWTYTTSGPVYSSPTVSPDGTTVLVGSSDKSLYALDSSSGAVLWSYETAGSIMSSPVVDSSGRVYFSSDDGMLTALDTK